MRSQTLQTLSTWMSVECGVQCSMMLMMTVVIVDVKLCIPSCKTADPADL